jgi:hypothetical protein
MSNEQLTMKNGDMGKGGCGERRNKNEELEVRSGELEVRNGDKGKVGCGEWEDIKVGSGKK